MSTMISPALPLVGIQQKERRARVKALERQWRTISTSEELKVALGEDAEAILAQIQQAIGTDPAHVQALALAWKIREEFRKDGLQVFTHGEVATLGAGIVWAEMWAEAQGKPLRSKERLVAPVRAQATSKDATNLAEFRRDFTLWIDDTQPSISSQLLSVSTEFFNQYALAYWTCAAANHTSRIISDSFAESPLSPGLKRHLEDLINSCINRSCTASKTNDLVLVAMSQTTFPEIGYLARPGGATRGGNLTAEFAHANEKIPVVLDNSNAQARLVARALHSHPHVESWRFSSRSKVTRVELRKEMAWIAAYAAWAIKHPEHVFLPYEEIQTTLSKDKEFLKSYLAHNGRFFKWLPLERQKDVELLQAAAKNGPEVVKHVRLAVLQEGSLPALDFLMKTEPLLTAFFLSDVEWVTQLAKQPEYEKRLKQWAIERLCPLQWCPQSFFYDLEWVKNLIRSSETPYQLLEEILQILKEEGSKWVAHATQERELKAFFIDYFKNGITPAFQEAQWESLLEEVESAIWQGVEEGRYSLASFPSKQKDPKWLAAAFNHADRVDRMVRFLKQLPQRAEWVNFAMDSEVKDLPLPAWVEAAFTDDPTLFTQEPDAFFTYSVFHPLIKERLKEGTYHFQDLPPIAQRDSEWIEAALAYHLKEKIDSLRVFLLEMSEQERLEALALFARYSRGKKAAKEPLPTDSFAQLPNALRGHPEFIASLNLNETHDAINWKILNRNPVLYIECLLQGQDLRPWMIYHEGWSDKVLHHPLLIALKKNEELWKGKCHDLQGLYQELLISPPLLQALLETSSLSDLVKLFAKTLSPDRFKQLTSSLPPDHIKAAQLALKLALKYHEKEFNGLKRWQIEYKISSLKEAMIPPFKTAVQEDQLVDFLRRL